MRGGPIQPDRWGRLNLDSSRETDFAASSRASGPRDMPGGLRPGLGALASQKAMPRTHEPTGRKRAVGTHFPTFAADASAADLAARLAARFKPGFPDDFHPKRDSEPSSRFADRRSGRATATDGYQGSPTSAHRSGRSTRSAGLGSGSTRTSTADRPSCSIRQLGWHCCCWENEPGMVGIPYLVLVIGNTSYHTIPSRMAP